MMIHVWQASAFEEWDWRNPDTKGIGGSETAHIEIARRLAARGHDVICYANVPADCKHEYCGVECPQCVGEFGRPHEYCQRCEGTGQLPVEWYHNRFANFDDPGFWVILRNPGCADNFTPRDDQHLTLLCEDVVYNAACGGEFTPGRAAKFDRILGLCDTHVNYLKQTFPFMSDKVVLSGNGIKTDAICQLPKQIRDPYKIVWASSPDRGLEALLHIFRRAREFETRLNLDVYYGFDNWNKVIDAFNAVPDNAGKTCPQQKMRDGIVKLMDQPGVTWHGRANQPTLWAAFASAGMWVYPTTFPETSCITCMEAQALGAIPITAPIWGTLHNVHHGVLIHGDPMQESLVHGRYVGEILRLARQPELQEQIRRQMIPHARDTFDWERIVDQYDGWIAAVETREAALCS